MGLNDQLPAHGLLHPRSLADWRRWQAARHPVRGVVRDLRSGLQGLSERHLTLRQTGPATGAATESAIESATGAATGPATGAGVADPEGAEGPEVTEGAEGTAYLALGSPDADILVVLDTLAPSSALALARPLAFLPAERLAVLSHEPADAILPAGLRSQPVTTTQWECALPYARVVAGAGDYLDLGGQAFAWARRHGHRRIVVQHGLMTPLAPPLGADVRLLAWSQADADFWWSGRQDAQSVVVGSQLLWEASRAGAAGTHPTQPDGIPAGMPSGPPSGAPSRPEAGQRPVFLGQLHGAELPWRQMARTAERFCRETGAVYRPHPGERDRASRLTHALFQRRGITIDRSGTPLAQLTSPVVSIFSTGVLEAAARGVPAWVTCADPPPWLRDFWARYDMKQWGDRPTPGPPIPSTEPATAVAAALAAASEESS